MGGTRVTGGPVKRKVEEAYFCFMSTIAFTKGSRSGNLGLHSLTQLLEEGFVWDEAVLVFLWAGGLQDGDNLLLL